MLCLSIIKKGEQHECSNTITAGNSNNNWVSICHTKLLDSTLVQDIALAGTFNSPIRCLRIMW